MARGKKIKTILKFDTSFDWNFKYLPNFNNWKIINNFINNEKY